MIKEYIQFAIDNGYPLQRNFELEDWYGFTNSEYWDSFNVPSILIIYTENDEVTWYPINDIITSKSFIEAIARWLSKKLLEEIIIWRYRLVMCNAELEDLIETLTTEQAIAIRDNKLEDFIKNLITK